MYPNICTHHSLHSNKENKPSFPDIYMKQLIEYDGTTTSGTQPRKISQQWENLYIRFDDDNKINGIYIISITYNWMSRLNHYNRIYCKEDKESDREN